MSAPYSMMEPRGKSGQFIVRFKRELIEARVGAATLAHWLQVGRYVEAPAEYHFADGYNLYKIGGNIGRTANPEPWLGFERGIVNPDDQFEFSPAFKLFFADRFASPENRPRLKELASQFEVGYPENDALPAFLSMDVLEGQHVPAFLNYGMGEPVFFTLKGVSGVADWHVRFPDAEFAEQVKPPMKRIVERRAYNVAHLIVKHHDRLEAEGLMPANPLDLFRLLPA